MVNGVAIPSGSLTIPPFRTIRGHAEARFRKVAEDILDEPHGCGGVSADAVLCDSMPAMASTTEKTDVRPASDQQVRRGAGKVGSAPFEFVRWSPEAETAVVAGFDVGLMAFSVPLICRQLAAVMHRYG